MGMYYLPPLAKNVPIFVSGSCFFQHIGIEHLFSRNKESILLGDYSVFPLAAFCGHTDHMPCSGSTCILGYLVQQQIADAFILQHKSSR